MPELEKSKLEAFAKQQMLRRAGLTDKMWSKFAGEAPKLSLRKPTDRPKDGWPGSSMLTVGDNGLEWSTPELVNTPAVIALESGRGHGQMKTNPLLAAKDNQPMNEVNIKGILVLDELAEIYAWFFGEDNITTPNGVKAQLAECSGDLVLRIDSPGGFVAAASSICTALKEYKGTARAVIESLAASAATLIMLEAETIQIGEFAEVMIHRASAGVDGTGPAIIKAGKYMLERDKVYAAAYAAKAKKDESEMLKLMDAETWFTAQQAIDIGLVDEMLPKAAADKEDDGEMAADPEAFKAASLAGFDLVDFLTD